MEAKVEAKGARTLTGEVVSNKMQKTIAVEIERLVKHPDLRQVHPPHAPSCWRTTRTARAKEGDTVTITPCRPMSRRKSWRLLEIVVEAAR